jgi:hypothetical protein
VVVYDQNETVTANFPLRKGELTEDLSATIFTSMTRVLPKR